MAANGIFPWLANPTAAPTMFCSAMKFSKKRLGNCFPNLSVKVEFFTSASSTTTSGFDSPSFIRASPNASRVDTDANRS